MNNYYLLNQSLCSLILSVNLIILATLFTSSSSATLPIPLFRTQVFPDVPDNPITKSSSSTKDLKLFFFNQTLDHFSYSPDSYRTFSQRYYVKDTYWGGDNSPIFVYLGDEQAIDNELGSIGFLEENAPHFNALIVYIEHRFYGRSNPLGTMANSLENPKIRGYFNSAQALADYAEIIMHVKRQYNATHSPTTVFGVSYAGMLATWFRLKYPHIAFGALASSAPILKHVISTDNYLQLVSKDYKSTSENCYTTIKESWSQMISLAIFQTNGIAILNKKLKTCSPLSLDNIMNFLLSTFMSAAQYDFPPSYPVATICKGIDGASKEINAIEKVREGLVSLKRINHTTCLPGTKVPGSSDATLSDTSLGWTWQMCSEMVYCGIISVRANDTESMFPMVVPPLNITDTIEQCKANYGVPPRPNWIEAYYGGQDIKLVLQRFGSNIIFSNGLRDPYSGSGILEDLSDTLRAVHTPLGAHGLDMCRTSQNDPDWLITMRKQEINIIKGWLVQYYADLNAANQ